MTIGSGEYAYDWIERWAIIPDTPTGRENGRTHGVAVSQTGNVVVFSQADPAVLIFSPEGSLVNAWGERFHGAHGLTLVEDGGEEFLWLTDEGTAEVSKNSLFGQTVQTLPKPDHPAYAEGRYSPTWVAVNEERFGGSGDIWVADGYGQSLVHRFDKAGQYLGAISGEEGAAGRFNCPHGIWADRRGGKAELYIADRGNKRVQVYDFEGNFLRAFGADFLHSPCCFATNGDTLYIPELFARLAILDAEDRLIAYIGDNPEAMATEGWPNVPADRIRPGFFNSPHGMAAAPNGDLYVVEWIIGGRITKLARKQGA